MEKGLHEFITNFHEKKFTQRTQGMSKGRKAKSDFYFAISFFISLRLCVKSLSLKQ